MEDEDAAEDDAMEDDGGETSDTGLPIVDPLSVPLR